MEEGGEMGRRGGILVTSQMAVSNAKLFLQ